jgi:iron complex transport system substrate-binding protein
MSAVPRVVSLLPSATEILCRIGGGHLLVGRGHECDWPRDTPDLALSRLPILTSPRMVRPHGTADEGSDTDFAAIDRAVRSHLAAPVETDARSLYTLDVELLTRLAPDVIITQDVCSVCSIDLSTVERIVNGMPRPPKVVSLNPSTVEDILDDHLRVGAAVGLERNSLDAVVQMRERLFSAGEFVNPFDEGPSVAFLEWTDPMFCAGHWTVQLIERAGGRHPLNATKPTTPQAGAAAGPQHGESRAGPSFTVTIDQLIESAPQYVIICPCGIDAQNAHKAAHSLSEQSWFRALPAYSLNKGSTHIAVIDGNHYFNRPGPRIVDAYEWLVAWLSGRNSQTLTVK